MAVKSADAQRPLSPFMLGQYYRFQLTSLLSISHRIAGVVLTVGTVFLAAWLVSAAIGPASYGGFVWCARSWLGQLLLFGWSWALFYHLCNGIRHMIWDTVHAIELKDIYLGGWIVVATALLLTAGTWILAYL